MADLELVPQHLHQAQQEECWAPSQALLGGVVAQMQRHEGSIVLSDPPDAPLPHVEADLSWSHVLRAIAGHDCSYL